MLRHRHILTKLCLGLGLVVTNRWRMLAVREHDHGCMFKKFFKRFGIVDKHVPGGGTHKGFDAARFSYLQRLDFLDVAIGRAKIEAIVGAATPFSKSVLIGKRLAIGSLRIDVRHIHESGNATRYRCGRLGCQITLVG